MQSKSVKQDSSDDEKDSSEEDVEDADCAAVTQPASNPRNNTMARLMSCPLSAFQENFGLFCSKAAS